MTTRATRCSPNQRSAWPASLTASRFSPVTALLLVATACQAVPPSRSTSIEKDVVIYGSTSAGIAAAVQAKLMGQSVVVVGPDTHLGGLSSSGLGWTDSGDKAVIGGVAREFYQRVFAHYASNNAWPWQPRADYGNRGQGAPAVDGDARTMWIFEPHVAERIFEDFVREHGITVYRDEWLDRDGGVDKRDGRIRAITMLSGETFTGKMFVDATYEGDLMAAAGVSYAVGREANSRYDETLNGVQTANDRYHQFDRPVDPYKVPGDPASGLLPRIHAGPPGAEGSGDRRVQAYCYRTCMTDHADNRVAWQRPADYDAGQYELLLRYLQAGGRGVFNKFDPIPNRKTDTNNHGAFSFDNIGASDRYPEADYEERRTIVAEHETYQKGLLWFLANDPRVPDEVRTEMQRWGLAADEFVDNGNWPHQLYVREARRMVSDWVQTERHLRGQTPTPRPIGMGSYNMDSHHVQRYVDANGHARNEGDVEISPGSPYPIDYGTIVPKRGECANLLVPVCLSSSHIAYGSIRMEPVFMILGQSAATAAALCIENDIAVQDLGYDTLAKRLQADGQVLSHPSKDYTDLASLEGIVIDDTQAILTGSWKTSTRAAGIHRGYRHDDGIGDGTCKASFSADLQAGSYKVQIAYTEHANRASNVPVHVAAARRLYSYMINQRQPPTGTSGFHTLDTLMLAGPTTIDITNHDADGHVIIDAVRFVRSR